MNCLALDTGTHCGWALLENGRLESGVQVFDLKRGESPGMRYVRFSRWLDEIAIIGGASLDAWKPRVEIICYEQAHQRGGAATEVAAGFVTHVQAFCARHGIQHASVHSATLKKFSTGKGNADKDMMLERARDRWTNVADDNEADALWLLDYAQKEII